LFPGIRASAEDLIIAVASKEGVIIFEVALMLEKDADCVTCECRATEAPEEL
jgi:hypothetical protein